jgi:Carboxypeptidase regulatory-like domain
LLLTPLPAAAQFSSALQGTITDSQQAFVPNATVRVTNATTGVTREAVTSADGVYRVPSLGAGVYTVEVEKAGFLKAQREQLKLGISETLRLDFTLEVSGVAETVTVESRAPLVETEQGRVSGRVDRTLLQEMPLSGRNLYNLLALQPGVTGRGFSASISGGGGADDSFAGESAPRINASGQRDEANNFTVDDTSTNGVARGGITNLTPNTESVEEVRVVSNNFSAVDGRNPGAQIQVITKGGTNEFRGSGSYYFTSNELSAKNVFEASVPEFSKNQFGYSLGGPIARNRLFFFTSYEGLRQTGARGSTFTVETPEFRNFVQQTRPNSIAARLLREFPSAVEPTSNFRDLGSPAPGANTVGPADGIRRRHRVFRARRMARWRSVQRPCRLRAEARTGSALWQLLSHPLVRRDRRHPAGLQPAHAQLDDVRQRQLHAHLQFFEAQRVSRRRDAAGRSARHPGTSRDSRHHHHRGHGMGAVGISERLVADQLALQGHLHVGRLEPPAQDGR